MHLFISKGDVLSSVDDGVAVMDGHQPEWDQQWDQYQYASQHCQNQQQHNQPPLQQQYYDHQYHHHQQQQKQQQGQCNHHTNQSYSTQQQQFNWQSQSHTINHHGDGRLLSTQYHYHGNPAIPDGARGQLYNYQLPMSIVPEAMFREPEKPVRPPTPPKIGWTCPKCTVINEPHRPGCEVCGENRPNDYKPPPGYIPTKDEVKWLQDEMKEKLHLEEVYQIIIPYSGKVWQIW